MGYYKNTCQNCQDRFVGCHATCKRYLDARAEGLEKKERADQARYAVNRLRSFQCESRARTTRKKLSGGA